MSKLSPTLPLGGYKRSWNGLSLQESYSGELVSIAKTQGNAPEFKAAFKSAFGKLPPKANHYIQTKKAVVAWSGEDQFLALTEGQNINADVDLAAALKGTAYTTLQSDGWASLTISGEGVYDVLERFIALDLRAAAVNFSTRTSAHHMAVILFKLSETDFKLLTPRSSAVSFIEALEHVIDDVAQP